MYMNVTHQDTIRIHAGYITILQDTYPIGTPPQKDRKTPVTPCREDVANERERELTEGEHRESKPPRLDPSSEFGVGKPTGVVFAALFPLRHLCKFVEGTSPRPDSSVTICAPRYPRNRVSADHGRLQRLHRERIIH